MSPAGRHPDTPTERPYVRVYAVVNWRRRSVHGITADLTRSQQWVREICDRYGPDAATQTVDVVDLPEATDDTP